MSGASRSPTQRSSGAALSRALGALGGLAVLGVAAVHLYEYTADSYSQIPTIGILFLLNGISAGIVGFGLLAPLERLVAPRLAGVGLALLAVGGIAISVGALVALFVSESTPLFGFMESGYRAIIIVAIVFEAAAIIILGAFLTSRLGRRRQALGQPTAG